MNKLYSEKEIIKLLDTLKRASFAQPTFEFRKNARIRLLNSISTETSGKGSLGSFAARRFSPVLRLATVFGLILLFLATTTLSLAQSSSLQDKLYPLKIASELVLLAVTPSDNWKSQLALGLVERRLAELQQLQSQGEQNLLAEGIQNLRQSIEYAQEISRKAGRQNDRKLGEYKQVLDNLTSVPAVRENLETPTPSEPAVTTPANPQKPQPAKGTTPQGVVPGQGPPAVKGINKNNPTNGQNNQNRGNQDNGNNDDGSQQQSPAQDLLPSPPVEIPNLTLP